MCTSPVRIINKGYKVNDPLSPKTLLVPCGHCDQCKQMRISEMLFRCDWQRQYVEALHGFTFFVTLTFNRDNLNYITYTNEKGTFTCSTWNNQAVQTFIRKMKALASRSNLELSYLITSERGKDGTYIRNGVVRKKTRRPHYHLIMWFVPSDGSIPSADVKRNMWLSIAPCWSTYKRVNRYAPANWSLDISEDVPNTLYVAKYEPIGYVYNEEVGRGDANATKYVVKYVVKDSGDFTFSVDPLRITSSTFPISYNSMRPKTMQSNGLGMYFTEFNGIDPISLAEHCSTLSDGSSSRVPRYYIQKLSRDIIVKSKTSVLDDELTYIDGCIDIKHKPTPSVLALLPPSCPASLVDGQLLQEDALTGARFSLKTESVRTDFGTDYLMHTHKLAVETLHKELHAFIAHGGYPFMFDSHVPAYAPEFGSDVSSCLLPILTNLHDSVSNICLSLGRLSLEEFTILYDVYYHGFPSYQLNNVEEDVTAQIVALQDFTLLRYMQHTLNKCCSDFSNKLKYERNLIQAAQRNPVLFNNPKNAE